MSHATASTLWSLSLQWYGPTLMCGDMQHDRKHGMAPTALSALLSRVVVVCVIMYLLHQLLLDPGLKAGLQLFKTKFLTTQLLCTSTCKYCMCSHRLCLESGKRPVDGSSLSTHTCPSPLL